MATAPTLYYFEKIPPYAVAAAASIAGVHVTFSPDPAASKDYVPRLKLPTRCAPTSLNVT